MNTNKLVFTTAIFYLSLGGLSACKKGIPEVSNLRSLSGFSVTQTSVATSSKIAPAFPVAGKCNGKYSDVQISTDGGTSWLSLSAVGSNTQINCGTQGTFSSDLAFKAGVFNTQKWTSSGTYTGVYIRGFSAFGLSDLVALSISNTGSSIGSITGGGSNTPLTGGNYKLKGEVTSLNAEPLMAGGNYKLQGEVIW